MRLEAIWKGNFVKVNVLLLDCNLGWFEVQILNWNLNSLLFKFVFLINFNETCNWFYVTWVANVLIPRIIDNWIWSNRNCNLNQNLNDFEVTLLKKPLNWILDAEQNSIPYKYFQIKVACPLAPNFSSPNSSLVFKKNRSSIKQ